MKNKIFISYSHKDKDIADEIDRDFKAIGITFIRDIRDVSYRESFKSFMKRVRSSDYVLMVISDSYLRSKNCMFEVLEFIKDKNYKKRILPIVLDDTNIYENLQIINYIDFWEDEIKELKESLGKLNQGEKPGKIVEELKILIQIKSSIGDFLKEIGDMKHVSLDTLRHTYYQDILEIIGIENPLLIQKLLAILDIKNIEERDFELENYLNDNPNAIYGIYAKAHLELESHNYAKAKMYYEKALIVSPTFVGAINDLAILLEDQFFDFKQARKLYIESLKITQDSIAHFNLANCLYKHFGQTREAIKHLEKAIKIDPFNFAAYSNLGVMLISAGRIKEAKKYFNKSIEINPNQPEPHYDLAILLSTEFKDYRLAKEHFLAAIKLKPEYDSAHYRLALLLLSQFKDYENAKKHLEMSLELVPDHVGYRISYGQLLADKFNDYKGAVHHLELALQKNLQSSFAHYALANIYREHIRDYLKAREHYELAIEIYPDDEAAHYNLAILLATHFQEYLKSKYHFERAIKINPKSFEAKYNLRILEREFINKT